MLQYRHWTSNVNRQRIFVALCLLMLTTFLYPVAVDSSRLTPASTGAGENCQGIATITKADTPHAETTVDFPHADQPPAFAPGDEYYYAKFGLQGASAAVNASTLAPNGSLYIGGLFRHVNGVFTDYIAQWNGMEWRSLGGGLDAPVCAVAVDAAGIVYVGGAFTEATNADGSTVSVNGIARWDGATWSALGGGVSGMVRALALDEAGTLYVGGDFTQATNANGTTITAQRIIRWDGEAWHPLGAGLDYAVRSLAVDGDQVYVGGDFTYGFNSDGTGISVNRIARWDGSGWFGFGSGLNNGVNSIVRAIAVAPNGDVYLGGDFSVVFRNGPSPDVHRVIRWDGSDWHLLGSPTSNGVNGTVHALTIDNSGTLFVGGLFFAAGNPDGTTASTPYIATWNGTSWGTLAGGATYQVYTLAQDGEAPLYAGGVFATVAGGTVVAQRIAVWDGTAWGAVGGGSIHGLNGVTLALQVDAGGNVYAGGGFTIAGNRRANYIARWDGVQWHPLGAGLNNGVNGPVYAIAIDAAGMVYVGGDFTEATNADGSTVNVNRIARWDGTAWSALGGGVNAIVRALVLDEADVLYVAGDFTEATNANGTPIGTRRIARWDGGAWHPLGVGGNNGVDQPVRALAVDGTRLYVGGDFTYGLNGDGTGISVNRIARWDGSGWYGFGSGLNNGVNSSVRAIAVAPTGDVYLGGDFSSVFRNGPSPDVDQIIRWDGSDWHLLGTPASNGVGSAVHALTFDPSGALYAGGLFVTAHNGNGSVVNARYIAKWDGVAWSALGSGNDFFVYALDVVPASASTPALLFEGGAFERAGDKVSVYIAAYEIDAPLAVSLASFEATPHPDHIQLTWETTEESQNLGFHLYRSLDKSTVGERITRELLPSQVPGGGGAYYTFMDSEVLAGRTYYYRLESVHFAGHTLLYGPVSVFYETPRASPRR